MHPIFAKAALALACISPLALGACTTTGFGVGYGSAGIYDDGYGYAQPGYGYGLGGYGGGWYNDFYYPGTGVYVIDRSGRRQRWSDDQRRYWQNRPHANRPGYGRPDGARPGFGRPGDNRPNFGRPGFGRPRPDGQGAGTPGVRPQDGRPRPSWGQGRPGREAFGGPRQSGRGFGGRGGPRTVPQATTPQR